MKKGVYSPSPACPPAHLCPSAGQGDDSGRPACARAGLGPAKGTPARDYPAALAASGGKIVIALATHCAWLAVFLAASLSQATTYNWKTNTTGDWSDAANWVEGSAPTNGDDAVITNIGAKATLSSSSSNLSSLTLSRTLTFTNWDTILYASNVTVLTGGTMNIASWTTNLTSSNNLYLVCTTLSISNGGVITATGRGFPGVEGASGLGPGGGSGSTVSGTYGGKGYGNGKSTYGDEAMPLEPGSAGGAIPTYTGGAGGGAIRIEASGDIIVDGQITADGSMPGVSYSSAGSGGAIYITCNTLRGSGLLSAAGEGNGVGSSYSKGGGGGRIAVIYNTTNQAVLSVPNLLFRVQSALSAGSGATQVGEPGTLYFLDNYFLRSPFRHSAQWQVPNFTNWSLDSLLITNACLWLPTNNFVLTLTNDLTILGTNAVLHRLRLRGSLQVGRNLEMSTSRVELLTGGGSGANLTCASNLLIKSGAALYAYAAATNPPPDYSAYIAVTGELSIATNGTLYLYCDTTNGGAPFVQAQTVNIAGGGLVDASGNGYKSTTTAGNGPGGGASGNRGGGGHGGRGGGVGTPGGVTNGSANYPLNAGSSGAGFSTPGGAGGGVARLIVSGTLTVNGTINAGGANGAANNSGGAGGSIWLQCRTFAGSGGLSANGGNGTAVNGAGGGGGRIAVWRMYDQLVTVTTSVTGGTGSGSGSAGDDGTVVWGQVPFPGTIIKMR